MATKTLTRSLEPMTEGQCVHYWIIDPPRGPVSKGVCKMCGAEKEFKNHVFYSPWDAESSPLSELGIDFDAESDDDTGEFIFVGNKRRRSSW